MRDPRPRQRRRFLRRLALGGFVAAGLPGVLRAMSRLPAGRSIHRLSGSVRVNGQLATEETVIRAGDTVETGPDSEVVFAVGEDAYLLRANSRVSLGGRGAVVSLLRVVTGAVLGVYGRGEKQIRTATATIGIRGTATYIEVEPVRTYLCTCYGTADIAAAADPRVTESVTTRHHEAPREIMALPDGGAVIRPAVVLNHTDAELVLLESLVGRVPLFTGDDGAGAY